MPDPVTPEPVLVEVSVEVYRLGDFMVIHRSRCHCDKEYSQYRQWRTVKVLHLTDLLWQLLPAKYTSGRTTREVCRTVAVAACKPPLPIEPYHRTLMRKQNTMGKIPIVTCPDATGKFIVHDPGCGHPARLRATNTGRGSHHQVASLADLVRALYAPETLGSSDSGNLEEIMERDFEIRDCTALPLDAPTALDDLTRKVLEAYSALVALHSTAQTRDSGCAERLRATMDRREETAPVLRQGLLIPDHVRDYVVTANEAACWTLLHDQVALMVGKGVNDLCKAAGWVKAAQSLVSRYRKGLEQPDQEGGTTMGRAFNEAVVAGNKRFIRSAADALNGMDGVLEELAEAQAQAEEKEIGEG